MSYTRFFLYVLTGLSVCLRVSPSNITDSVADSVADGLLRECWSSTSFSCVQNGLRRALETQLSADFDVTDSVRFVSNGHKYTWEANRPQVENITENLVEDDVSGDEHFHQFVKAVEDSEAVEEGRAPDAASTDSESAPKSSFTHVNGITDILYNRGVHYLMTHDLNLDMPEFMLGGGRVRVQPRSIEPDGGVVIKLNFDAPESAEQPEGRLFLKRIRQIFKKKLMTSFMSAMLIIKLIKVKLMFLLPVIVGVGTAKKILLKVLLFIFPALTHLFKLCAYYHHHHTKLSHHYHHHHGVNHHLHHGPPIYVPPPSYEYDHPPPGATIIHRSEDNVLDQWGIHYEEPENADDRIYTPPHAAHQVVRAEPQKGESNSDRSFYSDNTPFSTYILPGNTRGPALAHIRTPVAAPVAYPHHQQSYAPAAAAPVAAPPAYQSQHTALPYTQNNEDPFYSPILARLDRVFSELGFTEEGCKERLVCSMYKAPARFSPHSNLVSAEISRDPSELQKPVFQSPNVLRFFRYVAAARSGQDSKDCLALFPNCALLTE